MTTYATQALIGQEVTFTSKNTTDATKYVGVIEALVSPIIAPSFGDVVSYNAAVQKSDPSVGDPSTLTFFVITLSNGQPTPTTRIFSDAWISPGSFSVIQEAQIFNFNIYDLPSAGAAQILTVLKAAGYNAVQVTNPAALAISSTQGTTTVTNTTV